MGRPQQKYFPFKGGLDLVTSPLKVDPGALRSVRNYEQGLLGGYTRIEGYERVNGQPLPSEASYWTLDFDAGGLTDILAGMYIVGQSSGAVGIILSVTVTGGTWSGSDAAGEVRIYNVSGAFQDNEAISFIGVDDGLDSGFSGGFA